LKNQLWTIINTMMAFQKSKQSLHFKNQYNKYSVRIKTIQGSLKFYEGNETWLKGAKMI
jgi:hypothetical protein